MDEFSHSCCEQFPLTLTVSHLMLIVTYPKVPQVSPFLLQAFSKANGAHAAVGQARIRELAPSPEILNQLQEGERGVSGE